MVKRYHEIEDTGPQDFVEWTAISVAGVRNVESSRPDAYLQDALTPHLLQGSQRSLEYQERLAKAAAAHEAALGGGHVTTWIAVRSHVVGQQIVATLREPVPQESCQKHSQHAETPNIQQQVVLLGGGLDTQAWRLPLPPHVAWYEVDQKGVLDYKSSKLQAAGASMQAGQTNVAYPLKAASYTVVLADLSEADWTAKLRASGWREDVRTIWVAEGLLCYLETSAVAPLLKTVAAVSTPDSCLIATALTTAYVDHQRQLAATMQSGLLPELIKSFGWTLPANATDHFRQFNWQILRTIDLSQQARDMGVRLQPTADEPLTLEEHEAIVGDKVMVCRPSLAEACSPGES